MKLARHSVSRLLLLPLAAAVLAGCSTTVKITSDPPGLPAYVRGSGRAAYRWSFVGATPVECRKSYNAILTKVIWPDGTPSHEQRVSLLGEKEVQVHFQKPAAR